MQKTGATEASPSPGRGSSLEGLEFDARVADAEAVAAAIRRCSCAVLRHVFDPRLLARFRTVAAEGFAAVNALLTARNQPRVHETSAAIADSSTVDGEVVDARFRSVPIRYVGALADTIYAAHSRDFNHDLIGIVPHTFAEKVLRRLIGGPILFPFQYARVREQAVALPDGALPLHQDAGAVPSGADQPVYTCWVPFQNCGVNAPGLEFLPRRLDRVLSLAAGGGDKYGFGVDAAQLPREMVDDLRHPPFTLGDCLIFEEKTLHRTYMAEGMSMTRYSADIRACAANRPPSFMQGAPGAVI